MHNHTNILSTKSMWTATASIAKDRSHQERIKWFSDFLIIDSQKLHLDFVFFAQLAISLSAISTYCRLMSYPIYERSVCKAAIAVVPEL